MFVLVEMVDTVRIPPWQFERKLNDSIAEELNKKLANKVVYNVGLCICLFDITKLEDAYVFPGDGASHTKVHFRYVVFHPFLDEILIGKIKGCSPEGVHVSLGFFDDILIPPELASHLLSSIAWSFWSSSFYLLSAGITGVQYTLSFVEGRDGSQGLCTPCKYSTNHAASPAQGLTFF
ncbi:polymerase (RNA) III (DNA directed) polypeptide H (predicted), isoform CRA_b [Rattus norvegicus]|uniref:DNA-directed RNA polymerase subunit n=1 Tax=Rattus norvegicus TaxID=10116 RepID=A6HT26_RAT|nr:polymerase (RNA) III (DNA directed) polypeptide H (predicted), isoform CRA_b [Rattus norvegicus]